MSKRKKSVAGLDADRVAHPVPAKFAVENKQKRFKPDKAPDCAFQPSGKCKRMDSVLMEMTCSENHHVCMSCLLDNFQANLRFTDTADAKNKPVRTLTTFFLCPLCLDKNDTQEIYPTEKSIHQPHPHHISLFDDKKQHGCCYCDFGGSVMELYDHSESCPGWLVHCPECFQTLPPNKVEAHAPLCIGKRETKAFEVFTGKFAEWVKVHGPVDPYQTHRAMSAMMEFFELATKTLTVTEPKQWKLFARVLRDRVKAFAKVG